MSEPRIIRGAEARALREAAQQLPWTRAPGSNHIEGQRGHVATVSGDMQGLLDGRLILAAPDLAFTVERRERELEVVAGERDHAHECARAAREELDAVSLHRDRAIEMAERLSRTLASEPTASDAALLLLSVLLDEAEGAPNCASWDGSVGGRRFSVSVQWVDGESPHALLAAAKAELSALRDAARRLAAAERALTDAGDLRAQAAKIVDHDAALLALFALVPETSP